MQAKTGNNNVTIKTGNLSLVLRILQQEGVCARTMLATKTGLTQAAITYIVNELLAYGVVEETGVIKGELKRKSNGLKLTDKTYLIAAIVIQKTYYRVALFTLNGTLIEYRTDRFPLYSTPSDQLATIEERLKGLIHDHCPDDTNRIIAIGVGIYRQALSDAKGRYSDGESWSSLHIQERLENTFGMPVFIERDADCSVLAAQYCGHLDPHKDILYILMYEDDIISGMILNGELYKGASDCAGELGHISINYCGAPCDCGNVGCLHQYCSVDQMMEKYRSKLFSSGRLSLPVPDSMKFAEAIEVRDPLACEVAEEGFTMLGIGLVSVINTLNPAIISIESPFNPCSDYMYRILRRVFNRQLSKEVADRVEFIPSVFEYGGSILYGVWAMAFRNVTEDPVHYLKIGKSETNEKA